MPRTATLLFSAFAFLTLLASCQQELDTPENADMETMTITVGFEEPQTEAGSSGSKTYVTGDTQVRWSSLDIDKYIYVFDTKGKKNVFSSKATSASLTRSFTGSISQGSSVRLILWSGKLPDDDNSTISEADVPEESLGTGNESIGQGGTISFVTKASDNVNHTYITGSSLTVANPQQISHTNSFAPNANIAVMRPGDGALKSVFGYLRYIIPIGSDGSATIKSITITADEDIAGEISIDCSQQNPVASIVANGSKSITVNTRWQTKDGGYYEPGTLYAVLPEGVYHNMKVTITPFAGSARTQNAATGTPFTISCRGAVTICRGQYTDLGRLPTAKPSPSNPGFIFDTDYFTKVTDASGVVSYLIRSDAIGWENSQSLYYIMNEITNDERFLIFMISDNEYRPSYHVPSHSARILDLQTRKLYTFYASDGGYPYLDPVEDKLYYFLYDNNSTRTGGRFYRRDLLVDPSVDIPLAEYPRQLVVSGVNYAIKRAVSHITLTSDKQKVFLDSWLKEKNGEAFHWGMLNLYTGEWDEWGSSTEENVTHGQINPVHDDEVLCATDGWTDSKGVTHKMLKDSDGTSRRMQFVKKGSMKTIKPNPSNNGATHEGWTKDGNIVYFCSSGINTRNIRTDAYKLVLQTEPGVTQATHCHPSTDLKYWVYDDNTPYWYRGCKWKVSFYNDVTGKQVFIHSDLPAISVDKEYPSRIHPDPHPHFVCNDKYIVCSAAQDDGNLHFCITPVDQLINLTK